MSNAEQRVLGRRQNTNWDTVCLTPSRECAGKETEYKLGYSITPSRERRQNTKLGYSMSNAEHRVLGRDRIQNWDTVCLTPSRQCAGKETEYKLVYSIYNAEQRVCGEGDRIQTGIQYL